MFRAHATISDSKRSSRDLARATLATMCFVRLDLKRSLLRVAIVFVTLQLMFVSLYRTVIVKFSLCLSSLLCATV